VRPNYFIAPKLGPAQREQIGATRRLRPKMRRSEVLDLAARYDICFDYAQQLRAKYAKDHRLPRATGRPRKLTAEQARELVGLLELRYALLRQLSIKALAIRFNISYAAVNHYGRRQ
jgi:hypothetical protein